MIYLVNENNVVEMANQAMADIYGIDLDQMIGRPIQEFAEMGIITAENAIGFIENNLKVIHTQQAKLIAEESAMRKDGSTVWFQTTLTPFKQPGSPLKVIGVSTDITQRKKSEDHVRSMNQILESLVENRTADLQKANEELRSFAYSISHDLRAPLRAIDGFSKILVEEYSSQINQEAKRYLSLVQQNAVMMGKLIEGLLEFSRKGRQEMHLQTIETGKLVSAVLEDIRYDHPDHKAQVHIAPLPSITGDPLLIKQVYQNLLHNAFKFTSKTENPQIKVGCDIMEGQQIYYVKDNGTGFDMKYVDRLFGVFQRLHRTDEFEGTGVGLAITKRIITRHGGTIWAEAEVGKGAGFYFTFTTLGDKTDEQK
jgi:PAS domain S-box-containing protein